MEYDTSLILNLLPEPTVLPPAFLALCSTIILHRFASPAWWEHLKKHISAKLSSEEAFDRVVTLKVGIHCHELLRVAELLLY
jgi:hypothetical protein